MTVRRISDTIDKWKGPSSEAKPSEGVPIGSLFWEEDTAEIYFRVVNDWIQIGSAIGASDHGALSGLGDDDHLQYALLTGTRPFTGTVTVNDGNLVLDSDLGKIQFGENQAATIRLSQLGLNGVAFGNVPSGSPVLYTVEIGESGTGLDKAGANTNIYLSRGTGAAASPVLSFLAPIPHASDSVVQTYAFRFGIDNSAVHAWAPIFEVTNRDVTEAGNERSIRLLGVDAGTGSDYERLMLTGQTGVDYKMYVQAAGVGVLRGLQIGAASGRLGFYGTTAIVKPTVTGAKGSNAALASLLTQLVALGLIVDGSGA